MKESYIENLKKNFRPSIIVVSDKHSPKYYPAMDFGEACSCCLRILGDVHPYQFEIYDDPPTEPVKPSFELEDVPEELKYEAKSILIRYSHFQMKYNHELQKRKAYTDVMESQNLIDAYEFVLYYDHNIKINLEELK